MSLTSLAWEINWGCRSAHALISTVRYFYPLTCFTIWENSFYQACFLSKTISGRRSSFNLISTFHCLTILTDFVKEKLNHSLTSLSKNHFLSLIFFILIPDRWSNTPFSIIFVVACLHLWRNLPPYIELSSLSDGLNDGKCASNNLKVVV